MGRQSESGGLTLDVTAAENHATNLTIAASLVEAGVIWLGTDDGNVHVTRDGARPRHVHADTPTLGRVAELDWKVARADALLQDIERFLTNEIPEYREALRSAGFELLGTLSRVP